MPAAFGSWFGTNTTFEVIIKLTRRYKIKQSSGSQRPAEKKFQNGERKKKSSVGITWPSVLFEAQAKRSFKWIAKINERNYRQLYIS